MILHFSLSYLYLRVIPQIRINVRTPPPFHNFTSEMLSSGSPPLTFNICNLRRGLNVYVKYDSDPIYVYKWWRYILGVPKKKVIIFYGYPNATYIDNYKAGPPTDFQFSLRNLLKIDTNIESIRNRKIGDTHNYKIWK